MLVCASNDTSLLCRTGVHLITFVEGKGGGGGQVGEAKAHTLTSIFIAFRGLVVFVDSYIPYLFLGCSLRSFGWFLFFAAKKVCYSVLDIRTGMNNGEELQSMT